MLVGINISSSVHVDAPHLFLAHTSYNIRDNEGVGCNFVDWPMKRQFGSS